MIVWKCVWLSNEWYWKCLANFWPRQKEEDRAYQNHSNFDKLDNGIECGYLLAMMPNFKSISRLFIGFDFFSSFSFSSPSSLRFKTRFFVSHLDLFRCSKWLHKVKFELKPVALSIKIEKGSLMFWAAELEINAYKIYENCKLKNMEKLIEVCVLGQVQVSLVFLCIQQNTFQRNA